MRDSSQAARWFVARAGESKGPYTWPQLRTAAEQGLVEPRDWVWRSGMRKWVRAAEQDGLLDQDGPPPIPADADSSSPGLEPDVIASVDHPPPAPDERTVNARPPVPRSPSSPLEPGAFGERSERPGAPAVDLTPEKVQSEMASGERSLPSLGETTRQFLAAAGVSEKVRRRRHRRAGIAVLIGLGALVALDRYSEDTDDGPEPPVMVTEVDTPAPPPAAMDAVDRQEACRLTGDCRAPIPRPNPETPSSAEAEGRRGDTPPSAVSIGALQTGGGQVDGPEKQVANVDLPTADRPDALSETQTFIVKKKVSPGLKNCGGVYARSAVVVRVQTDGGGNVQRVRVPRGPSRVRRCLKRRAKYWRFGPALANRELQLTIPAKRGVVRVAAVTE